MNAALTSFTPILVLSIGSLGYLLFGKLIERVRIAGLLAVLLVAATMWFTFGLADSTAAVSYGVVVNTATRFLAIVACAGALLSITLSAGSLERENVAMINEYYYLLLTSLCGALVMVFASDFLTLFIGVEVASLALYCLCGARISERRSSEASMKYFLLGCFSSAFLLYGIALWYGATGSLALSPAGEGVRMMGSMTALSFLMILVGVAFKIGLAPFHFWVPDVYQGAPISVTTFMSCVVKVAAVAALLKVGASCFGFSELWMVGPLWIISMLAMTVGNLAALQQRSVKRMLAYSSVAQAGYMLIGVVVAGKTPEALAATLFYLVVYSAMTIGAFGVLSIISPDADDVKDLRGLGKRSPFLALVMTLIFLALAGLPPGLAGLMGKVYLFSAAISAKFYGLAIVAALNSALACAYYFRVPMAIYFQEPESTAPVTVPAAAFVALSLCGVAVVLFGVMPEPLLDAVRAASESLLVQAR
jgi:NADH-quinone oxidoreductase subunit N